MIEIDAASNRGIEDIRSLKEKAYLLPSRLKKKVFIIDEVHMLTREAFNALLKLIEEPPINTTFILCTTDREKIPETVLSRLIKVDFKKGTRKELLASLTKIIKGEKLKIEEAAIRKIIDNSDGSFRNLHKLTNEIVLRLGTKIDVDELNDYFSKNIGDYWPEDLENDLKKLEVKTILTKLELLAEKGADFGRIRGIWLEYFQKRILNVFGVGEGEPGLGLEDLQRLANLLINAGKIEREVEIDQLPLELAIVEFIGNRSVNPGEIKEERMSEEKPVEKPVEKPEKKSDVRPDAKTDLKKEVLEKEWGRLLTSIRPFNHSVEAFLRAARPKEIKGKVVVLEVFYPFHKEKLEENKNRLIVEKCLTSIFGMELFFECQLGHSRKAPLVISNDTPVEKISERLKDENIKEKDIYDVAKEIFG
jgi:DNA polymerase-3 subunit gamma/tau